MKKTFKTVCAALLLTAMPATAATQPTKASVKETMTQVADWQISHFDTDSRAGDLDWTCGALYIGMYQWAELSEQLDGTPKYFDFLRLIGDRNKWACARRIYHADDICVGQTWLKMGDKFQNENMKKPTIERANYVETHHSDATLILDYRKSHTLDRWSWCDALFMAPPVYLQLYNETGEQRYLDFMKSEYRATYDLLYDKSEQMFYRDYRYVGKKEKNGSKVFWGRGNGWVIAGLANMLKVYPKSDAEGYKYFKDLFVEMAGRLAELQQPDGYWHASLLDPASYPSPETSSTGFITYGLAYGVNAGLLPKAKYTPVVMKGWDALCRAVESDGKLGWVQPVGADPQKVTRDNTAVYGPGAFLSAGCEIYKMLKK